MKTKPPPLPRPEAAGPKTTTGGLHHVTAITRRVQANVDFYVGFLGLRLVKRTAGFEDAQQLHLFYGDATGAPGTLITFLVWEGGAPGRVGLGQIAELAVSVPQDSIGDWLTRALAAGVPVRGPERAFGETLLRLKDPDGITVKLVGGKGPMRLHSVLLLSDQPAQTAAFLAPFGYRAGLAEGAVQRLVSAHDVIDIRAAAGFVPGIPGTGTLDHLALRLPDEAALARAETALRDGAGLVSARKNRKYFTSLYTREPGGVLAELATDTPGMGVDEPAETLGQTLFLPPHARENAADLAVQLPQFAQPGEDRLPMRNLPFEHRFHHPDEPDGSVLVLLHGTGGNEADLMPLAHRIAPRATLLGVRGRSHEEGVARWFRRLSMAQFDQADIRTEAEAFAAFIEGAVSGYGLDAARLTCLGYSNGANFITAVMGLSPQLIRRAILLRAMPALDPLPMADLAGMRVLMLNGAQDPYGQFGPALADWLQASGALLDARVLPAGHALVQADMEIARDWLAATG
ncbi:MAG: VOC family protein [Pararhodobacter sp.]